MGMKMSEYGNLAIHARLLTLPWRDRRSCSIPQNYSPSRATAGLVSYGTAYRNWIDLVTFSRLAATLGARSQTRRLSRKDYTSVDIIKSWYVVNLPFAINI